MEKELRDLSQAVGVVDRHRSDQQKRSTVLSLLVLVPMGLLGMGVPQPLAIPLPGYEQ